MKKKALLLTTLLSLLVIGLVYLLFIRTNKPATIDEKRALANETSLTNQYEDWYQNKSPKQWKEINDEYKFTIEVFGKQLPVVQSKDTKEKYLHTNIYGGDDFYGTPYLDVGNNLDDGNLIVFGHSSSKKDLVFSFVKRFEADEIWGEIEANTIKVITEDKESTFIPYALIKLDQGQDSNYLGWFTHDINTQEDFNTLTKDILKYGERIQTTQDAYNGQLLTLVTCNLQEESEDLRYVLIYRRID